MFSILNLIVLFGLLVTIALSWPDDLLGYDGDSDQDNNEDQYENGNDKEESYSNNGGNVVKKVKDGEKERLVG